MMLRSKTFMVPGWDGPTAAPQGCKLRGEAGSGRIWSLPKAPKLPPGAGWELRSCRASGRSWELLGLRSLPCPAGASPAGCCKAGGPPGCCRAVARPGRPSGILQQGCCEAGGAPEECPVPWERCRQLETSLCQVTISARNDVPRGGSGSGRLPAGPPPPSPLPRPPPRPCPAGSAGSVPSGTCWSPTCPASGTSHLSPRDGGDPTGPARGRGLQAAAPAEGRVSERGLILPHQHGPGVHRSQPSTGTVAWGGTGPVPPLGRCHEALGQPQVRGQGEGGGAATGTVPAGVWRRGCV